MYLYPVVAFLQHGLVACGTLYFFRGLYILRPSLLYLPVAFLFSFFPLFQALQNNLLTEGYTLAGLLFGFGSLVRILSGNTTAFCYVIIVLSGFWLGLFRLHYVPMLALALFIVSCYQRKLFTRRVVIAGLCFLIAATWQLGIKSIAFGHLITTKSVYDILTAYWANPDPTPEQCNQLNQFELPEGVSGETICFGTFRWAETSAIYSYWRVRGYSYDRIMDNVSVMSDIIITGRTGNRLLFALGSSGFLLPMLLKKDQLVGREISLGKPLTGVQMFQRGRLLYSGFSGLNSQKMMLDHLDAHFQKSQTSLKIDRGWRNWAWMYSANLIDPFRLGKLYPDIIAFFGVASALLLILINPPLGLSFLIFWVLHGYVVYSIPYYSPRYAFANLALSFFCLAAVLPHVNDKIQKVACINAFLKR